MDSIGLTPTDDSAHLRHALTSALAEHDSDAVAALLRSSLWRLVDECPDLIYPSLNALDEHELAHAPELAGVRSICAVMSAPYEVTEASPPAVRATAASDDEGTIAFSRMLRLRSQGLFQSANDAANDVRAWVNQRLALPSADESNVFGSYLLHAGSSALLAGDLSQALKDLNSAGLMARRIGAVVVERDTTARSAILYGLTGRISQISPTLNRIATDPKDPALRQFMHDSMLVARAIEAVERLDPTVRDLVDQLDLLDPINELWPITLLLRGRLALAEGTPTRVLDDIAMALGSHPQREDGLGSDVIRALRIQALTATHESAAALALAEPEPPDWAIFTRIARLEALTMFDRTDLAATSAAAIRRSMEEPSAIRDQALLASAYLSFHEHRTVDPSIALGIHSLLIGEHKRRAVLWLPRAVLDAVAESLPAALKSEFDAVASDLSFAAVRTPAPVFSPAELRVLNTIATSKNIPVAAERLYVSENTVKTHLTSIYRKFGVHGRSEALREANRFGLLDANRGTSPPDDLD